MAERNGTSHSAKQDSALDERTRDLTKMLGTDLWAKYPRSVMEFRMNAAPVDEAARENWVPFNKDVHDRVFHTYMRYSWLHPICMPYAVVCDPSDHWLVDHMHRPLVLSEERVAEILALSKQRVSQVVLDLVARKWIRVERAPGRQHTMAVYLEARPLLTEEDLRVKSTLDATGVDGPKLEPAVQRRFTSLFNQFGSDDERVLIPRLDGQEGTEWVDVSVLRTLAWKRVLDRRTTLLSLWKAAKYSERKGYADDGTWARNLIAQIQSRESRHGAGASTFVGATEPQVQSVAPAESFQEEVEARHTPKAAPDPELVRQLAAWIRELQGQFRSTDFGRVPVTLDDAGDRTTITRIATTLSSGGRDGFASLLGFQFEVMQKFKGIDPKRNVAAFEPRSPDRSNGPKSLGLLVTWAEDWARSQSE